ncbi:MAG: AsmA family protein, partial [Pseudomonadota bacterium]|nr:AsmA family protein [Pseudomonadota bacterium]
TFFPTMTLHVDDFGIKSPPLFPPSYILKVARIDARLDPWTLLRRRIVINSLVLEAPVINLVSDPDGPWNFENTKAQNGPRSFRVGTIATVKIHRGQLYVSNLLPSDAGGRAFFEAHDISSELENVNVDAIADPKSRTLDGEGTLHAAALRFTAIETRNVSAHLRLQARAVSFTGVRAETYGGSTRGDLTVKLSGKRPSFTADLQMKGIDMAHLLTAFPNARGKMTGKMDGDLKIAGEIAHAADPMKSLHGSGHLTVRDGQVPSLKLNANLMKLAHYNDLGPAKDDPSSFNSISTDLELDHERISSKAIDIDGYGVDIDGSGSVSLSGSDQLDYKGVAQIVAKQGFITNLFARLAGGTLKDGKLAFPFHIGGTIDNPVFARGR